MTRASFCVAMAAALFAFWPQSAHAQTVFCPANLYYKPIGNAGDDKPASLYGFTLEAAGASTVTAMLAFETDTGWFKVQVPTVRIVPTKHYFTDRREGSFLETAYDSPVMYVRFQMPVLPINAFVLGADGQACPPPQRPSTIDAALTANTEIRDPHYPDPTTVAPGRGAVVLDASKSEPLFKTECAQPFQQAAVKHAYAPDMPEETQLHGENGTAYIQVILNPGGSLASASIVVSSGDYTLDQIALKSAQQSTYESAIAYCQPVSGSYLFKVTFG